MAALLAATLAAVTATPAAADFSRTEQVSVGPSGGNQPGAAVDGGLSQNGRMAVFDTYASLVPADTDGRLDLYARAGGVTRLLSTAPGTGNGPYDAHGIGLSPDGKRAFFATTEPLVPSDTDNQYDVYERSGRTTTLVTAGTSQRVDLNYVAVSRDGQSVAFTTTEGLVPQDVDGQNDIYEWSAGTGTIRLMTPGTSIGLENAYWMSADGSKVFFETVEPLVPEDTDACHFSGCTDVYESDNGAYTLVSTGPPPTTGEASASLGGISADGSHVFFTTRETLSSDDLDAGGLCGSVGCTDVYDRSGGTTTFVSSGPYPANYRDSDVTFAGNSADGSTAYFETYGRFTLDDTDNDNDLYSHRAGTTELVSTGPGPAGADASFLQLVGSSPDGTRTYFTTEGQMVAADTDICFDVYERSGGTTTLVSTGPQPVSNCSNAGFNGATPDGSRVFFSTGDALVPEDADGPCHFFADDGTPVATPCNDVYERHDGVTTLISTGPTGGTASQQAYFTGMSRTGRVVSFLTADQVVPSDNDPYCYGPDPPDTDPDQCPDVFVRRITGPRE